MMTDSEDGARGTAPTPEGEPMTAERIAYLGSVSMTREEGYELLAEVERLREANADLERGVAYLREVNESLLDHNTRACNERDHLRARLAEIGETRPEWGYTQTYPNGTIFTEAECDRDCAERAISRTEQPAKLIRRLAGEWREVPHA